MSLVGGAGEISRLHATVFQVWPVDGITQVFPQPGFGTANGDQFVILGFVEAIVGVSATEHTLTAARHDAIGKVVAHVGRGREQRERGVKVRDIHQLALARTLAGKQGKHDAGHAVHRRAGVVSNDIEWNRRRPFGLADQIGHASERQIVEVMSRVVSVRPVLAKAAERAIDQPRIELA